MQIYHQRNFCSLNLSVLKYKHLCKCIHRVGFIGGIPGQCPGKNQANLSYYLQTLRLELHCSWLHASPCALAVSTTRPYLMYTTNARAHNRKQSTKVLRELIQMTMMTEKLKNFPRFARYMDRRYAPLGTPFRSDH